MKKQWIILLSFFLLVFSIFQYNPIVKSSGINVPTNLDTRTIIVVNSSGSGDFRIIQNAINSAKNGDTIYVEAGTYQENIIINKSLNVIGFRADVTIIDGSNTGDVIIITENNVNISGLSITGCCKNPNEK